MGSVVLCLEDETLARRVQTLAESVGASVRHAPAHRPDPAVLVRDDLVLMGPAVAAALPEGRWSAPVLVVVDVADPPSAAWAAALRIGAERLVRVPDDESWLLARLVAAGGRGEPARHVAVVAGVSGGGASLLACALATAAARRGARALLVDADPWGAGLDLALGLEDAAGLRWPVRAAGARPGAPSPRAGDLPVTVDGVRLLAHARPAAAGPAPDLELGAARGLVESLASSADLVVTDHARPPRTLDRALLARARTVLLVTRDTVRSAAATARWAEALRQGPVPWTLVVRGRTPGGLPGADLAAHLGAGSWWVLPDDPAAVAAWERGLPPARRAPVLRSAALLLDRLATEGRRVDDDDPGLVAARVSGLGVLHPLVTDPRVTDVLVNAGGRVWVDRGEGLQAESLRLSGEREVRALAVALAARAGRRLDDALPFVDVPLPGGLRLHAVLPPLAPDGTHISLRVLRSARADLARLVAAGSVPAAWRPVLEAVTARRLGYLVSGGTGAGKTTLLAALLAQVPAQERIVIVEDVAELRPWHPHVVRLEARRANVEGRGAVGLDELVRQALRMRPDRLVVGEFRGAELRELLGALNTGHAGGCATVHANRAHDVPARLVALGAAAGLAPETVALQAGAALDAVVHLERTPAGRRVGEIAVLQVVDARLVVTPALVHDGATGTRGPGWPALARRLGLAP